MSCFYSILTALKHAAIKKISPQVNIKTAFVSLSEIFWVKKSFFPFNFFEKYKKILKVYVMDALAHFLSKIALLVQKLQCSKYFKFLNVILPLTQFRNVLKGITHTLYDDIKHDTDKF